MEESKKRSKKQVLRKHIEATIARNLEDLKETIGEKKFEKKIKKASKVLVAGLPKQIRANKKKAASQPSLVATN